LHLIVPWKYNVSVWLPEGNWYDFWNDKKIYRKPDFKLLCCYRSLAGFHKGRVDHSYVPFAKSTFFIPQDSLLIHVYTGADGSFHFMKTMVLLKSSGQETNSVQLILIHQNELELSAGSHGDFTGALDHRAYRIIYHGLSASTTLYCDTSYQILF